VRAARHLAHAGAPPAAQQAALIGILRADPTLMALLLALRPLALPQWRLVSGAVYQSVWNALTGRAPGHGIKDYDVCYFDGDVSYEAEDRIIRQVAAATGPLGLPVETRNQARVHLWFEGRFGVPYEPLRSTDEGLARYAAKVHAIGVRLEADGEISLAAPFGLDDLFSFVVRPNPVLANEGSYTEKAARAKALWPELTILPWSGRSPAGP
jgi:uncharacterized protein